MGDVKVPHAWETPQTPLCVYVPEILNALNDHVLSQMTGQSHGCGSDARFEADHNGLNFTQPASNAHAGGALACKPM